MSICRGLGNSALGKLLHTSKTLAHTHCLGLTVRAISTAVPERPPLTMIKSYLNLRMLEATSTRPVPDSVILQIIDDWQPNFKPHRCLLDGRFCLSTFRGKQKKKTAKAVGPKRMRRQQTSLFKDVDFSDLQP